MDFTLNENKTELTIHQGDLDDYDTPRFELDISDVEELIKDLIEYKAVMKVDVKRQELYKLLTQRNELEAKIAKLQGEMK